MLGSPESIVRIINPEPEMMIAARCLGQNGVTYFSNPVTALKEFPNRDPIGHFDSTSADTFSGWACDYNSYSMPLEIHFYLDGPAGSGTFIGSGRAFENREKAVGDLCGNVTEHGFKIPYTQLSAAGQNTLKDGNPHTVYAYAINVPTGNNPLLGMLPTLAYGDSGNPGPNSYPYYDSGAMRAPSKESQLAAALAALDALVKKLVALMPR
jgi:hypothetical protein